MPRCNNASGVPVAASANGLLLPAAAEAARAAFLAKETPRVENGADLSATNVLPARADDRGHATRPTPAPTKSFIASPSVGSPHPHSRPRNNGPGS